MKLLFLSASILIFASSSCRKFKEEKVVAKAEAFKPSNIYPVDRLPQHFNRVALLPCYYPDSANSILNFCDQVFHQELSQERIFEIIQLSPKELKSLTGHERIASSRNLPSNFLKIIEEYTSANGVLFIDLDSYKPYRPMSLGVRSKLVDLKSGEFMWAIDETFDAGHASVIVGASQFQDISQVRALSNKTNGSVLHSPRNFTKYVASTVFSTLPRR
jgi:hypothetical protein